MTSFNFTESKQKVDEHVKKECSNQNVEKGKQGLQMKKKYLYSIHKLEYQFPSCCRLP